MVTQDLSGSSIVGFSRGPRTGTHFRAINPATGLQIPPDYWSAGLPELERASQLAAAASPILSRVSGRDKAKFLRTIAANIEALGQELFDRVVCETGLPGARAQGETARTCFQLRLFAEVAEEGSWVDARIDRSDTSRKPSPKPDVRSLLRPLGPVAVFGASNFPLAFSVAGGDTASAFAAGCPVIAKAHPAHPGTSEMIGCAVLQAVNECGLPEGTFSLLFDAGYEIAAALVTRPEVKAVGFTGSRRGGRALMDAAATRPTPIPFYAEMGSINPIFLLPGVFRRDWEARVSGLFASVTLGSGQFCTKPGLVFLEESSHAGEFATLFSQMMARHDMCTMLAPGILRAYQEGISEREKQKSILTLVQSKAPSGDAIQAGAALFRTDAKSYLSDRTLNDEIFGPATVLVTYSSRDELLEIARSFEGHLTATVHGDHEDLEDGELVAILETKVGRLIFNGFPTGVEVGHSMVHGGPWPASSDGRSTSVGSRAILRFARPVCYQDFPETSLPDELKDANPLGIWRMVDGRLTRESAARDT